jgi:hypothetical protein
MTTRKWTLIGVGLVALLVVAVALIRALHQQPSMSFDPAVASLTIEEYPIVAAEVDSPGHFEFLDRMPDAVLARR